MAFAGASIWLEMSGALTSAPAFPRSFSEHRERLVMALRVGRSQGVIFEEFNFDSPGESPSTRKPPQRIANNLGREKAPRTRQPSY
jgi:hypothetical protein